MLILRSRGLNDNNGAIANYEESVEFLTKLPEKDLEVLQKCAHIIISVLFASPAFSFHDN